MTAAELFSQLVAPAFSNRQVVSGLQLTPELRKKYAKDSINVQNIKSTQVKSKITLN